MADDDKKPEAKAIDALLDPATRAQLERWFNLPSFEALADDGKEPPPPPEDPDVAFVRERREKAIAAVDPVLLETIERRFDGKGDSMILFKPDLEVNIDPDNLACFDYSMIDRQAAIADPREVEISEDLRDDLKDCTPQAILRDLHRPEIDFDKTFEIVDMAAEQRLDIVAEVSLAMRTNWKLPPLEDLPFRAACAEVAQVVALRRTPWPALLLSHPLPNRRVRE